MKKGRLEAFSDGVIAIIITIMVLEFKVPHGSSLSDLKDLLPVFLSYLLSFIYLGIYWNNHHHLVYALRDVSGDILWANLHLLFWLSLVPFATGWIGENKFAPLPMAIYGFILFMAAVAYTILSMRILKKESKNSKLAIAIGKDQKGKISLLLYLSGILSCWINTWIAGGLYIAVALIWLIPDRRIENVIRQSEIE